MIIASQKRKENIAEYLLYMWQIEDMIRANDLEIDKIQTNIIDRFQDLTPEQKKEITEWYDSLIDMMRREGVAEHGHLQINRNILGELTELHKQLLGDSRFNRYQSLYYKVLPYIVELRSKAGAVAEDEIATCFTALYGMLILKLQGKEVSEETARAISEITTLVATLSAYYHKNENEPLFTPSDL
ncbi:MAG: DUF4924 family protein [Muribaculaceae bacterium]|nr:DUF4924 family protein [Muribaculaceae bacterium]MDE7110720.1 DUF4924 family protein [Muribaculaceae bacterium]